MLFNEPKLLKYAAFPSTSPRFPSFSALQRAEIAEIILAFVHPDAAQVGFSALQRAEIAEIVAVEVVDDLVFDVSVLFNEPKLLKFDACTVHDRRTQGFSALQRAEIAEISSQRLMWSAFPAFQCSSTSRNC